MKKDLLTLLCILLISATSAIAQTRTIKGVVVGAADKLPLPGVSVVVPQTTLGTVTGIDGGFTLKVPEKTESISCSFIGMETKVVTLTGSDTYNINLESSTQKVDEVVVTALGISREKKSLGYAVQEVKGESLNQSKESNVVSSLSGKVAGVQVSGGTAGMGGSSRILIRGAGSITGENQPLFVVDGIPIDNTDFNDSETDRGAGGVDYGNMTQDINPEDIESMSVLKGPSAAALYGSRAANGVVMITTKKGSKRKGIGVTVNSGVTFQNVNLLPDYQCDYGGGNTDEVQTATINGRKYNVAEYAYDSSWGPKYDPDLKMLHWDAYFEDDPENYLKERAWVTPKHDVKDFFRTGINTKNSISLSGGGDVATFRLSVTSDNTKGYVPGSNMDKYSVSLNTTAKLGKFLQGIAQVTYVNTAAKARPVTGYSDKSIMQKFTQFGQRQLDMERLKNYKDPVTGAQRTWNRTSWDNPLPRYADNPYWIQYENYNTDQRNRITGMVGLLADINDNFNASLKVYKDYYTFRQEDRIAVGSQAVSSYSEAINEVNQDNYEFILNYHKDLTSDLNLTAFAGMNFRKESIYKNKQETQGGLVIPNLYVLTNNRDGVLVDEDFKSIRKVFSTYGSFSLGYKNQYYLDGTFRNDWSSTLPKSDFSFFYPSFTASVILSKYSFLQKYSWLNFAKIRGSWAMVGNDTDPYKLKEAYLVQSPNFGSTPKYKTPATLNNPNLKPETVFNGEIGFEARMFDNRVSLDFTYYKVLTQDLITDIALSGATGYSYKMVNGGSMSNKGIELMFSVTPVKTSDFQWDFSLNFNKNKNKLLSLLDGVDNYRMANAPFQASINAFVGKEYGAIMGTDYVRDDNGNKLLTPDGKYRKTNDVEILGDVIPDFNMGLSNSFNYKRFDASILFDIQKGGQYFSTSQMFGMQSGMLKGSVWQNGKDIRAEGVVIDGYYGDVDESGHFYYTDANGNKVDKPVKNTKKLTGREYSEQYYSIGPDAMDVFDATYVKLREVTLGYNFPAEWLGPINKLRLSVFGRNLGIWALDNKSFDPESAVTSSGNVQGIEGAALPSTASYGFNINFSF